MRPCRPFAFVRAAACAVAWLATGGVCLAQSATTIYGLLDAGSRFVDNVGGSRLATLGSGDQQSPRLGFRGSEDLGAGTSAVFQLEAGILLDTGTIAQGGRGFGRQAYAGLVTPQGTVTAGRQYDFMVELGAYHAVQAGTGTLDWNLGDLDRVAGERFDNSIKYTYSQGPFHGGLLYAFGEVPGQASRASAGSAMARYAAGPLSIGVAATQARDVPVVPFSALGVPTFLGQATVTGSGAPVVLQVDRSTNVGVGASYRLGAKATVMGLYTRTELSRAADSDRLHSRHLALRYALTPHTVLTGSLSSSRFAQAGWSRGALSLDRFLSARTDLYLSAITERATGADVRAVLFTVPPSGDQHQSAIVAGVRHRF